MSTRFKEGVVIGYKFPDTNVTVSAGEVYSMIDDIRGASVKPMTLTNLFARDETFCDTKDSPLSWITFTGCCFVCCTFDDEDFTMSAFVDCMFKNCSFKGTKFGCACAIRTDFYSCDFTRSRLNSFRATSCVFNSCDFRNAFLTSGTDLLGGDSAFNCNINVPERMPMACPKEGGFIAWKKAYIYPFLSDKGFNHAFEERLPVLIKLYIPDDARRSSASGKKCRCDKAQVLDITDLREKTHFLSAISGHDFSFAYPVDTTVHPDFFTEDRWTECGSGIHFFMDKQDAIDY